ncbi:uncharacterized protein TNCV_2497051 [Trichonephila clavipes]|nr:uncharacterized protein TNCV_2497051 [Trichonephila clavipes]
MVEKPTNWEVYKTQFCIISEANGWNEGVKACQLAASLRGEATEILQTLSDIERLNLNSLYNALDLRFGQKYSNKYARLQMKTSLQINRRKLAGICLRSRKARQLGFIRSPSNCERNNLFTVFRGRPEGGGNSEDSDRKNRNFIRGARVTEDEPCESRLLKEMEILKEEMQTIKAGISNHEKRNFSFWGCGGTGHPRRNFPDQGRMRTPSLLPNRKTNIWPSRGAEVAR